MAELDTDFFVQTTKDAPENVSYVDLSCFKAVIKGLCKSGSEMDFIQVQPLLQKMKDLDIRPDGTILSSILQSEWCDDGILAGLPLTAATCSHAFKFVKTKQDLDNCFEMYGRLSDPRS